MSVSNAIVGLLFAAIPFANWFVCDRVWKLIREDNRRNMESNERCLEGLVKFSAEIAEALGRKPPPKKEEPRA